MRKKPYKFFALGLPGHRGFDLLVDHFNLAAAGLPREMLEAAWRGRAMDIGQVNGRRDAYTLTMRLSVHSGTSHEGAFSIRLTRQSDRLDLVRLSFILYPLGTSPLGAGPLDASPSGTGSYTVAIGGLQGSKEPEAKRAVIDATRDLCGLRPKDAALLVIEGIAIGGGADHVLGVCDARHTINFRSPEKRARKRADMDQYWIDRGGCEGGEFGFAMPVRSRDMAAPLSRRDVYKFEFLEFGKRLFASMPRLNEVPLDLPAGGPHPMKCGRKHIIVGWRRGVILPLPMSEFAPRQGKKTISHLAKIAERPMDIAGTEEGPSDLCFNHLRPWSYKETQKADATPHREHPASAIVCRKVFGPDWISEEERCTIGPSSPEQATARARRSPC